MRQKGRLQQTYQASFKQMHPPSIRMCHKPSLEQSSCQRCQANGVISIQLSSKKTVIHRDLKSIVEGLYGQPKKVRLLREQAHNVHQDKKLQQQLKNCTFHPNIHSSSSITPGSQGKPESAYEKGLTWKRVHTSKMDSLRHQKMEKQKNEQIKLQQQIELQKNKYKKNLEKLNSSRIVNSSMTQLHRSAGSYASLHYKKKDLLSTSMLQDQKSSLNVETGALTSMNELVDGQDGHSQNNQHSSQQMLKGSPSLLGSLRTPQKQGSIKKQVSYSDQYKLRKNLHQPSNSSLSKSRNMISSLNDSKISYRNQEMELANSQTHAGQNPQLKTITLQSDRKESHDSIKHHQHKDQNILIDAQIMADQ